MRHERCVTQAATLRSYLLGGVVGLWAVIAPCMAVAQVDTITLVPPPAPPAAPNDGSAAIVRDALNRFVVRGAFVATDVTGGGLLVPLGSELQVRGVNWWFDFSYVVKGRPNVVPPIAPWDITGPIQGARGTTLTLSRGRHLNAPHGEEFNLLPRERSSRRPFIPFGNVQQDDQKRRSVNVYGSDKHEDHLDTYSMTSQVIAMKDRPALGMHQLQGKFKIDAKHTKNPTKSRPIGVTMGSSSANSTVSFDAASGILGFDIGRIDILDREGGFSRAVDPAYARDPILASEWLATGIELVGFEDGRYRFGPGEIDVIDPRGVKDGFNFSASFDEYFISNTADNKFLSSFAQLSSLTFGDIVDDPASSLFLDDFAVTNLNGEGFTERQWLNIAGLDFAFVTDSSLADLTDGFTLSARHIPATFLITMNQIPGPPTLAGFVVSLFVVGARRRRRPPLWKEGEQTIDSPNAGRAVPHVLSGRHLH